jgi:hypothetical protein
LTGISRCKRRSVRGTALRMPMDRAVAGHRARAGWCVCCVHHRVMAVAVVVCLLVLLAWGGGGRVRRGGCTPTKTQQPDKDRSE